MNISNLDGYKATILDVDVAFVVKNDFKDEKELEEGSAYAYFEKDCSTICFSLEACKDLSENDFKRIIRHEMIHAYMYNSSLQPDLYPVDEEFLTEWIAQMFPRMEQNFKKAYKALEGAANKKNTK